MSVSGMSASLVQNPDLGRWLRFLPSQRVRIATGKVEIGQGIVTAIALLVGIALGIPTLIYLEVYGIELEGIGGLTLMGVAMESRWYGELSAAAVSGPVIALVVIVSLAVTYPALKAALIDPVRAINHR